MDIKESVEYLKGYKYDNEVSEAIETVLTELEKKDLEISALQMEHEHDVKMIDEVKGESVKLYSEIEKQKYLYQKALDNSINLEAEKINKNKLIEELIKIIITLKETSNADCFIPRSYRDINECIKTNCTDCIIGYFRESFGLF